MAFAAFTRRRAGGIMRWLFTGKGMLTYSPSIVGRFG
jgi:hypothetical protein